MRDKLINVTKERDHIALMCVKVEKVSGICRYRNGTNTLPSILSEKPHGTKCSLKSSSVQIVSDSRAKKYQMFSQGMKNHQKLLFKRTKCTLLYMYFFLSFFEKRTDQFPRPNSAQVRTLQEVSQTVMKMNSREGTESTIIKSYIKEHLNHSQKNIFFFFTVNILDLFCYFLTY